MQVNYTHKKQVGGRPPVEATVTLDYELADSWDVDGPEVLRWATIAVRRSPSPRWPATPPLRLRVVGDLPETDDDIVMWDCLTGAIRSISTRL